MSETNKFDNFIKDGLGKLSPGVSPDMWDRIVTEREKRRPGGFWLSFLNNKGPLIIAGLLGTGVIGTSLILNSTKGVVTNTSVSALKPDQSFGDISNGKSSDPVKEKTESVVGKRSVISKPSDLRTSGNINFTPPKRAQSDIQNSDEKYISPVADNETSNTDEENSGNVNSVKEDFMQRVTLTNTMVQSNIIDRIPGDVLRMKTIPKVYLPDCPEIEKDAAANKKYIEVYAGPDIIFRNFSDTSNSVYMQKRKESTKVISAYSAGFRYAKIFKNGMGVKTGINYSQINERFSFIQSNLVQVTYIIDPQTGDTTGSYTVTGTRKKITDNKYRFIDIPLFVGYELGNGRFHANISAGAMINIYSWQRGDVLDTTYQPVSISTGKISSPYQFRSNIGVSLAGGVSMYYKLTNQMHLMAEPYFRYSLNPMSKDALSFKQKYNTLGLHVGVRLDLQ